MRNFIFLYILLSPFHVLSQVSPCKDAFEQIVQAEREHYKKLLAAPKSLTGMNYDMKYQRLYWEVDPEVIFIKGSITTCFKPIVSDMAEISFDMALPLICDSVVYHGLQLTPDHTGNELTIGLPGIIPAGQIDSITIHYHGIPPQNGSFSRGSHGSDSILWTLSEPYGAMDWMPCKQALTDKIDSVDIFIRCPSQYRAASNGILISETVTGSGKLAHWKHRHPVATYLLALAVTNYAVYSDWAHYPGGDSVEILNYVYPEYLADAQQASPVTATLINLFNQRFIVYPFSDEKYGHAQCGFFGGMEHQTMTFCGDLNYEIVVHELAHQWFGDYITCGSWRDIWLNEGFATFLTGWSHQNMFNGFYWNTWKTNKINHVTSQTDGSVFCSDTTSVNRIFDQRLSYSKGALILHMLRWELGDSVLFDAIHNYLTDSALADGFAYTDDLVHHLEAASGISLTGFFNDWYYGEGYPVYNLIWSQDSGNVVTLQVNQSQTHPSVSFFEMDLPVRFSGPGTDTICRLHNNMDSQVFSIPLGFNVESVQFDPDQWILTKNPVILPVENLDSGNDILIIPNPVKDFITIKSTGIKQIRGYDITDMNGKQLESASFQHDGIRDIQISVMNLSTGKYILRLMTDKKTVTKVFVKG